MKSLNFKIICILGVVIIIGIGIVLYIYSKRGNSFEDYIDTVGDIDNTGDVVDIVYSESAEYFVNYDEFIDAIPADNLIAFKQSVPADILSNYPNLTFEYMEDTTVHSRYDDGIVDFIYEYGGYSILTY